MLLYDVESLLMLLYDVTVTPRAALWRYTRLVLLYDVTLCPMLLYDAILCLVLLYDVTLTLHTVLWRHTCLVLFYHADRDKPGFDPGGGSASLIWRPGFRVIWPWWSRGACRPRYLGPGVGWRAARSPISQPNVPSGNILLAWRPPKIKHRTPKFPETRADPMLV